MMNTKREIELANDPIQLIRIALHILDIIREDEIDHPPIERRMHFEIEQALIKALKVSCNIL